MARVFYDATNNKEVYDTAGVMTQAEAIANHGLTAAAQEVDLLPGEAQEIVGGVLGKYDTVVRGNADKAAKDAARAGKRTALLAKLNAGRTGPALDEADLDDLVA